MSSPSDGTLHAEPVVAIGETGPAAYSINETASILRINRKTVIAMIDHGELPSVRYARRRWVPARAVRQLLMLDTQFPTAPRRRG